MTMDCTCKFCGSEIESGETACPDVDYCPSHWEEAGRKHPDFPEYASHADKMLEATS